MKPFPRRQKLSQVLHFTEMNFLLRIPKIRAGVGWRKRQNLMDCSLLFCNREINPQTATKFYDCRKNRLIVFDPCILWICTKRTLHKPKIGSYSSKRWSRYKPMISLQPKSLRPLRELTLAPELAASSSEMLQNSINKRF